MIMLSGKEQASLLLSDGQRAGLFTAMKGIKYEITSPVTLVFEDAEVQCYGIKCLKDGVEILKYTDILPDKEKVEELVDICNTMDVDPEQFTEILEDLLP